jgi:alpha-tubulin suppressor-like RCC1 family protein
MRQSAFLATLCAAGLLGCALESGRETQASALQRAEQAQHARPEAAARVCREPGAGCACAGNQAPIRCAPGEDTPELRDAGAGVCLEGTRFCRNGRWGACEQIVSYAKDKHAAQNALVDPTAMHAKCSDCEPNCFRVPDNFDPADGPLVPAIASGIQYDNSGAGVELSPITPPPSMPPPDGGVPAGALYITMSDGLTGTDKHMSRANPSLGQIYFLFDQSSSMAEESQWFYDDFDTGMIVDPMVACTDGDQTLVSGGISGALRCLTRDPQVGVGMFRDLPFEPYATDQSLPAVDQTADALREIAYANVRNQTPNLADVKLGLTEMSVQSSGDPDIASSQIPALHALATGQGMFMGIERAAVNDASCGAGSFGYPCFPGGSKPVVVLVTDSPFHNGPNPSMYPYDYDSAKLGMLQGTTPGLTSIPLGTNDWGSAYAVAGDAGTTLSALRGSTTSMMPLVSPSLVGCGADPNVGDAVVRFDLAAPGHVELSTAQSSFPTSLAVFNGAVLGPQTLPDADHSNELFSSAYDMGSVVGRELVVHGDTSDAASTDMAADYQGSLFGANCGANSRAPDAVFKFDVPSGAASPVDVELSLDMGTAQGVVSVYEVGGGALPRWPAQVSPLMASGNIDAYPPHVFTIPSGTGNEYLTVIGDTSTLASSYDQGTLGYCGRDDDSNDGAFKIHVQGTHRLRFDTEGSTWDTVLSLHSAPPLVKSGNAHTWKATETHNNTNESAATAYATGPVNGLSLIFQGDTTGMARDVVDTFGCGLDKACADAVYQIEVSERTTLRLQVTGTLNQPGLVVTRADPAGVSSRYAALALGDNHSCALSGGKAYCWGADDVGQLGDGGGAGDPDASAAVQVALPTDAVQIAADGNQNCAVTAQQGNVYCWGAGSAGQLGDGGTSDRYAPVEVDGGALADVAQVSCGNAHCCALLHSGGVRCWGDNARGQLGDGGVVTQSSLPVAVVTSELFEQIAANGDHTCAIRVADEGVFCWGSGAYGALGNGGNADSAVPVQAGSLSAVTHLLAGQDHNCALQSNGHVSCWGRGEKGRLGRGADVSDYATPGYVQAPDGTPLANAKAGFAGGRSHSCVAMQNGMVDCWGDNALLQLADGGVAPSMFAAPVYDILDAVTVVGSADHSCALRADGSLMCWGDSAHAKLGDGGGAATPRPVAAQPGAPQVSFGNGTLDTAFSAGCGPLTAPPEVGCTPANNAGRNYFFCDDLPRTFSGAALSCAAVGYQLAQIDAGGENSFVASGLHGPTWIGAKHRSSPDWLSLTPTLDYEDLDGNPVWTTEQVGNDDCSSGTCIWTPTRGFFIVPTFDLIDSEPWTPASTWISDAQPSPMLGQNCATLDPATKWTSANCASSDPLPPWISGPSALVASSLAGHFAAPDFAGGVEHDYACEQRTQYTDITLDPGKYYVTVKGGDDGVTTNQCEGPYELHIDDLGTPGGGLITCDDDGVANTTQSVIERTLTTGDYYLVLKGWATPDGGPYRLTVRDLDAVQTNEIACDAGGGSGDPATFSFAATPGKSYYALVKGEAPGDKGAYTLNVRDKGGSTRLACDAGSGPDGASVLGLDLAVGSYFAVLTGRDMTASGEYRLTVGGAPPVASTFVAPSYSDTIAALAAAKIRVATVLSCDTNVASCADAKAQADQLGVDARGVVRVAATAADVPSEAVNAVQLLEAIDTLDAQLLFTPDSDPGFANPRVAAIDDPANGCLPGSSSMSFSNCIAGAKPSFSVSLKNPALRPVPPSPSPDGAYHFTLRIRGTREGDTVFSEDVPVLVVPTGATPPMTYTTGSYHQDFEASGCAGNEQPSWDRLSFDVDVLPDTAVRFYACTADLVGDLSSCAVGAPSSNEQRVVTITAGTGNGTPCTVATQDVDCPLGYCSPYSNICNYLEGATCTLDSDCPGSAAGRCRPGPSAATLGYTCEVSNSVADPSSALDGDNYRSAMRVRIDLDSLGDGSRTPSVYFWETQYRCRSLE